MNDYERKSAFYQQFNTVLENWQAWCQTPQGTMEILKDPWKAHPPQVLVRTSDVLDSTSILEQIRARRAAAAAQKGTDNETELSSDHQG